ncbi:CalY family protein [Candidatus Bathyarchaeota archaeon]|nr:CalY family protein [Candidatus Bathyarchaeota archaeon]
MASIFVIGMLALAMGYGTYSWFSTLTVPVGNTVFTAGIMSMGHASTTTNMPTNLAPGDGPFTVTFELTNTGNIDIMYLATSFTIDPAGSIGQEFAAHINVTGWREWIPGAGWQDNFGLNQKIYELVGDGALPLTLLEVVQAYTPDEIAWHLTHNHREAPFLVLDQFGNYVKFDSDYITGGGYDQLPGPAIKVGLGNYAMEITFEFMESAGNDLQGQTLTLSTQFFGMQDLSQRP